MKKTIEGKTILGFEILEHGFCLIHLSDSYAISTETLCRYVGADGDFISSQDHGKIFGTPEPYDSASEIDKAIKGKEIKKIHITEDTGDVTLFLETGRIEIICNSAGYECYQVNGPNNLSIVGRGGK